MCGCCKATSRTRLRRDGALDAVISQEAFLHVPDKGRVLREAHRILRSGGRLAFTDWICHAQLSAADATLMWEGMAVQTLQSLEGYRSLSKAPD